VSGELVSGRRPARLAVALVLVAAVGACGSSGTELREPPAGVTSPAPTSTSTSTTIPFFSLSSSAFELGGELPASYTCGATSPPFTWSSVPADAVELVLTATSPADDGLQVHWVVGGIDPTSTGIIEGTVPLDAFEGPNSAGGFGWDGPCPDAGETITVEFTLAALLEPSEVDPSMSATEVVEHLVTLPATRAVATASVTGAAPTTTAEPTSTTADR
jgi:phosphatidylethanolamine-binding protein (PEBP) family uncharacterized protein